MLLTVFKKSKNIIRLTGVLLLLGFASPVWAAGTSDSSVFSNPLAVTLIVLMTLLLIIIGVLATILLGAADIKIRKDKKSSATLSIVSLLVFLLLSSTSMFAQNGAVNMPAATTASGIGGMSAMTFYIMASVIFLELTVIIVLLVNIKFLLKVEKEKIAATEKIKVITEEEKKSRLSWWDKFNLLRPVTQEAELDLGHDYDGIRELNNRLPPWWLYGFYLTIIVAFVYFWRYQVSHSAPSSKEEYETEVAKGDFEVAQYLKMKGDNVDENTVTLLKGAEDIAAGKAIFTNPQFCMSCHREDAGGREGLGPNLTDDYWIYGGSIKDLFKTIKYGTTKGMRSWKDDLSAKQIAQVASYVKSLHGTNPVNPKAPQGDLYKEGPIAKPAADSIKMLNDSIKAKENKVVMN